MELKKRKEVKMNRLFIIVMSCLLMHNIAFMQTPANDPHWQLIWEDQFTDPNLSQWWKSHNSDHDGEPQLYLNHNVWVSNGNLVIEVNNNQAIHPTTGEVKKYTSGSVGTRYEYHTRFGYIEARIKIPYKNGWGFWPAFWTWRGYTQNWTNAAEIDIFEMLGERYSSNTTTTNVHTCYPSEDPNCIKPNNFQAHILSNFDYRDWHTYAIEWNADKIIWYVDNVAIRTLKNANLDNYGNSIIDSVQIILNVAILKDYLPPTFPPFQEYMYIDYVKVYQLRCDKNSVVTKITNFNTYD